MGHGLYVAMSRVGKSDNVKIFAKNSYVKEKKGTYINNVVYPEVLSWIWDGDSRGISQQISE